MKTTFTCLTILLLLSCACGKNDSNADYNPELPPITQTGQNTFGCKIDGQVMVPRDSRKNHPGGGGYAKGVIYSQEDEGIDKYHWIKAVDRFTDRGGVAFKLPNIQTLGVGTYELETVVPGFASTHPNVIYMQSKFNNDLYGSIKGTGRITITRYDDEVISGTFYGQLKGYNNPESIITITEGRFDFNKKTIYTHKFY